MPTGPDHEPTEAAAQMRRATRRLRDRAWMVAPMTTMPMTPDAGAADDPGAESWTTPGGVHVTVTSSDARELTPELRELINERLDAEPVVTPGATHHIVLQYGSELPLL